MNKQPVQGHTLLSKIILLLSILCAGFWYAAQLKAVYRSSAGNGILEFFWLPMQVLLGALPLIAMVFFIIEKFKLRSFYLYSILVMAAIILYLLLG